MLEKPVSESIIINCLDSSYDLNVTTLTFLPIGADINASVYKAQTLDQTSYFVKIKYGHNDASVEILELLQSAGIQQIIPPVKTIHDKPTESLDDYTVIVYPFIEGEDGFNCDLTDIQWITLGKTLRQLHEVTVPSSMQNRMRKETYSSKWREAIRSMYDHIEAEPIADEIALKLQKFMKSHMSDIRRLVDRAEQLAVKLRDLPLKLVLCHSDIHGGNVLMDKNSNIYIVDWDDPIMAPKERDLMFIGGGVANVWNKPLEEKLFYKGYGETEINRTALAYYRHERIVEDIAVYAQEVLLTTDRNEERLEMYTHLVAMFEPQGVIEIAFKTGEN
ncbi:MAG: aminoglycoside phosphotransferase family protein [Chlamydiae bacterium]|nr:aminoglycoside phosphotransferase family protein [Chlamydiota bacterium]